MTHEQVRDGDIIEQYVRRKLSPLDRQAFEEHYFECDDCFEQVQVTARFVAGVREASSGVLTGSDRVRDAPPGFFAGWFPSWSMPALAASALLACVLLGALTVKVWRENLWLAQQLRDERRVAEDSRSLEATEKASLRQEISRLEGQLAAAQPQPVTPPAVGEPAINIYPAGDALRSAGGGEINRVKLPPRAATFVLILSDFPPGASNYQVEITHSSGRMVMKRDRLTPDRNGEISLSLQRSSFSPGKYAIRLFGQGKAIAEYPVEIE